MKVYNTEKDTQEILREAEFIMNEIEFQIQKYEKEKGVKPDVIELTSTEFKFLLYAAKKQFNYPVETVDMDNSSYGAIKVIVV